MINIPIMNKIEILVVVIGADDIVIDVSSRHAPEIQRRFVAHRIPP
jgi:hypothetical protein